VILETQGLVPALEAYVRQQQEGGLAFHLQVDGFSGRLAAWAERALFGIVREAIGNVKKHAMAQNVWITVTGQDHTLQIEVRDDGLGFDVARTELEYDQRGSLGMLNMRERAESIDGELSIRSQPDAGTSVLLIVPLHSLHEERASATPCP
jgi:signal transduction histidine kinase